MPLAAFGSADLYDEQVGITFTQPFSTLAFNVTAVPLVDKNGIGPGYLVNGLTDLGYWYQVGLSYNWPMTNGIVNPGFSMNYEVFSPGPHSIFPSGGGGGLQPFNGTVNSGDSVLLSLSFSAGSVLMQAVDWQTGSVSVQSFSAVANSPFFLGLTSSLEQSGFFSGLMTEQYHYYPYLDAGLPVTYSSTGSSILSAWMWIHEWDTNTGQTLFDANTTSPILLDKSVGHYFSSNGTAEIANAHMLVTGLTPVTLPNLVSGLQETGQPGHRASVNIAMEDQDGATVRFENLTILTDFGSYNFTLGTPFTFGPGVGQYFVTISVPGTVKLGTYKLTIDVMSWIYLDTQAQVWIPLHPGAINETMVVANSQPPPGQRPSASTNRTTFSPSSVLGIFGSVLLPIVGGYTALGILAVALLVRQERRRSQLPPIRALRFCQSCGRELSPGTTLCPSCDISTNNKNNTGSLSSTAIQQDQTSTTSQTVV